MIETTGLVQAELAGDASVIETLPSQAVPLRQAGTPEEVAGLIVFMASKSCACLTGETVLPNGGYTLGPGMDVDHGGNYVA
jgi:NAD(P)-dependent dehydrogenase (short-subunit alcohol dehydrogenase family)